MCARRSNLVRNEFLPGARLYYSCWVNTYKNVVEVFRDTHILYTYTYTYVMCVYIYMNVYARGLAIVESGIAIWSGSSVRSGVRDKCSGGTSAWKSTRHNGRAGIRARNARDAWGCWARCTRVCGFARRENSGCRLVPPSLCRIPPVRPAVPRCHKQPAQLAHSYFSKVFRVPVSNSDIHYS